MGKYFHMSRCCVARIRYVPGRLEKVCYILLQFANKYDVLGFVCSGPCWAGVGLVWASLCWAVMASPCWANMALVWASLC